MSTTPHDDGGSAFPSHVTTDHNGTPVVSWVKGMSLRDYFAAAVLTGLVARNGIADIKHTTDKDGMDQTVRGLAKLATDTDSSFDCCGIGEAIIAYEVADAMLAARKGGAQ